MDCGWVPRQFYTAALPCGDAEKVEQAHMREFLAPISRHTQLQLLFRQQLLRGPKCLADRPNKPGNCISGILRLARRERARADDHQPCCPHERPCRTASQRCSLLQLRRQPLAELHVGLRHVADPDAPDLL